MKTGTMADGGPTFQWYDQGELDPGRHKDYQGDHSFFYHPSTDTVHIGTGSMHHANIHDQARANGIKGDLHAGWSFDGQFGSNMAPDVHDRLYDTFARMHMNTLGEHLINENEGGWDDTFSKVAIDAGPDEATWDPEDMTDEEHDEALMQDYDIRDPYANFDHANPIKRVDNPVPQEHREDDHSDSPQGREAWDFDQQDSPVVFDGKRFYMGSPNSYHWDMIKHDPELAQHFDTSQYMQKNPLNATKPEDRAGLAYGRFNPASETTTWYHRGRFHPHKFDELAQKTWPGHYDESEDMGFQNADEHWQNLFSKVADAEERNAPQHHLGWEPGWPGKGIYHKGELTTWGINSTRHLAGWPHHAQMWQQKYGGDIMQAFHGEPPAFLFNIEPEGTFREAHPFRGDYEESAEQVKQIEPRLRRESDPSWGKMF